MAGSHHLRLALVLATLLALTGDEGRSPEVADLKALITTLRPLHQPLAPIRPGDWLEHHDESGQTFAEYLDSSPIRPAANRRTLVLQPIGTFSEAQRRLLTATADCLGRFYALPLRLAPDLDAGLIPAAQQRRHPQDQQLQWRSDWILDDLLRPRLPADALAVLGLTATDLWPGEGWNFVFGQASLSQRVGVWSLARNGDPAGSDDLRRICLRRTLKTALHETGHMLSLLHCRLYECGMNGANHREESDRHPLWFCPECEAKVLFATAAPARARYQALAAWFAEAGLADEAAFYQRSAARLARPQP